MHNTLKVNAYLVKAKVVFGSTANLTRLQWYASLALTCGLVVIQMQLDLCIYKLIYVGFTPHPEPSV